MTDNPLQCLMRVYWELNKFECKETLTQDREGIFWLCPRGHYFTNEEVRKGFAVTQTKKEMEGV